jgi:REP element-mobilizing transposase RayT
MPRKARIDAPGALHHIIIRGIEKKAIFRRDKDRERFVARLGKVLLDTSTPCFAWALLSNHAHFLLRTGGVPIATVMRRLLTGYAQEFNRRYRRHGQLFQNRYKSILCEEDTYLLELVRYIHLNPIRAGMVEKFEKLKDYPWSGHGALVGRVEREWQDTHYVLGYFSKAQKKARMAYVSFVSEGIKGGRRPELIGGGLVRSVGGWTALKELRREGLRIKGDERILGGERFVEEVLKQAEEEFEIRTRAESKGMTVATVMASIAHHYEVDLDELRSGTKARKVVKARTALCYLAIRKLGATAVELAGELNISPSAVSKSVARGQALARKEELTKFLR